jgi:hypothetical protein
MGKRLIEFMAHIQPTNITNALNKITKCALNDREKISREKGITIKNANSV